MFKFSSISFRENRRGVGNLGFPQPAKSRVSFSLVPFLFLCVRRVSQRKRNELGGRGAKAPVCLCTKGASAFSLVEMLMALLVASLLMVALAPVITKKFSESLSISSIGGTRADYKRTWYYDPAKEYHEWSVPNGVNVIKVTAIGGGGAGGGSSYGSKEFTSNTTWQVPEGVTQLRVFMIGGGGAGGNGGAGTAVYKGNIGGTAGNSGDITADKAWDIPASAKANIPELPKLCKDSGVTKWQLVADTSKEIEPGTTYLHILACGGGGGGGGYGCSSCCKGGAGGSGGKLDEDYYISSSITKFNIKIGGAGGYGDSDANSGTSRGTGTGGAGGPANKNRVLSYQGGNYGASGICTPGGSCENGGSGGLGGIGDGAGGAGGGGNGSAGSNITTPTTVWGGSGQGGAGAGGYTSFSKYVYWSPSGAGGGGSSLAGGGAGPGGGGGGGGGGGPTWIQELGYDVVAPGGGGGGGGPCEDGSATGGGGGGGGGKGGGNGGNSSQYYAGTPGIKGTNGNDGVDQTGGVSPIGNASYCAGGNGGASSGKSGTQGKPGYMKISWGPQTEALQCRYSQVANGGGGGGAGQFWFGLIDVTPKTTLTMTVGKGGEPSDTYGGTGGSGTATSIVTPTSTFTVSGGEGGQYISSEASTTGSGGGGGRLKTSGGNNWINLDTTKYNDLKTYTAADGIDGGLATDTPKGGKGGAAVDKTGTILAQTNEGNAGGNGDDAGAYGAGGGGGGGVAVASGTPGFGGKGKGGYIYVEWGGKNGGGGASGQVITQESIWVTPGTIVKIYTGKGGAAKALTVLKDGAGVEQGYKGEDGEDGGDTYLIVKDASAEKKVGIAKGGKGGIAGGKDHGRGGGIKTDASGNYDPANIQPEIEHSAPGETATDEKGGMGGTIDEVMCPLLTELKKVGLGGCGGNTTTAGSCQNAMLVSGAGVNAGGLGNGGGGGAVVDKVPFKGGDGSGGMVTIEWSN